MNADVKKLPKGKVEMTIELSSEELAPFLKKASARLSEKNKIAGFRPGLAPYDIVEKQLGMMAIYEEAVEDILNHSYFKAIKENKLAPIEQPKVEILKFAPQNPFIYKAEFSVFPKVTVGDYQKIKIQKKEIKVSPKQLEETLKEIQRMRAKETIANREIKKGDKVLFSLNMLINKVPLEGGQSQNTQIIIGDKFFVPGLGENLIGLKKGEEKEFSLKFPDNHFDKKLAGRLVDFKIKINEVYQIEYPEINNEFIKTLGKFTDVENFKTELQKNLLEEEKVKDDQRMEIKILDNLRDKSEFEEIPERLIEMEVEKMFSELESHVKQQGMKMGDYLDHIKKTTEILKEEFKQKADQRVKTILLINQVAKDNKISVGGEEIEKLKQESLQLYSYNPEMAKNIQREEYKDYLYSVLRNRKTISLLKEKILK